jgi:hypothetical protein
LSTGGKAPKDLETDTPPVAVPANGSDDVAKEIVAAAQFLKRYGGWVGSAVVLPTLAAAGYLILQIHGLDTRLVSLEASFSAHRNQHNQQWAQHEKGDHERPAPDLVPAPPEPPAASVEPAPPGIASAAPVAPVLRTIPSSVVPREPPACVSKSTKHRIACEEATNCVGAEAFKPDFFQRLRDQAGVDGSMLVCDEKAAQGNP